MLPDLSAWRWETLAINSQAVRQLTGLDHPAIALDASPDGRWLALAVETVRREGEAAIAIIDTQGSNHWWLNTRAFVPVADISPSYSALYRSMWLPDGRLLWRDEENRIFVGDGENRRDLGAPEGMSWVRYASDGIAFASAEDGSLWRADVNSGTWEEVTTPRPPEAGTLGGFFVIAQDGSYGLALQEGQMWRVPSQTGTIAEPLPDVEIELVGTDRPLPPSLQLGNTPYWLINLPITLEELERGIWANGYIVDERDGRVLMAADFALAEEYYLIEYNAPESGEWLAVSLWHGEPLQQKGLYVAASDDLTGGRLVESTSLSVAGWSEEQPAVIFRDNQTGARSGVRLPITDETAMTPLTGAGEWLTAVPSGILTTDSQESARLFHFTLDGDLLATLDLSAHYTSVNSAATFSDDRVFLSTTGVSADNRCLYTLVEWTVNP